MLHYNICCVCGSQSWHVVVAIVVIGFVIGAVVSLTEYKKGYTIYCLFTIIYKVANV